MQPICPFGKHKPEVSANEGFYLKPNQVYYKDYFASRPLTEDLAINTQIIQQHGGIVYDHYDQSLGRNRGSGGLKSFGTSSAIDGHIRGNNEQHGYRPSQLVENAFDDNGRGSYNQYAPEQPKTSLREFSDQLKNSQGHSLSTEAQLEQRRSSVGVVGMKKFSLGGGMTKSAAIPGGGGFKKTASSAPVTRDEQQVINQFRANKKKVTGGRLNINDDIESIDSISFEEI